MHYADRLEAAVAARESPCCVGLDPHLDLLPPEFAAAHDPAASRAEVAAAVGDFLTRVVELVADLVPAVKPQSAFFEALGADGAVQWERVVATAHAADLLVLGDVKRGDIGSTAAAYARAFLTGGHGTPPETLCDAITVHPYLGTDAIEPFVDAAEATGRGLYVLVRTSNPSSAELQARGDPPLSDQVAELVDRWGAGCVGERGWSAVGAVVGATHPGELARLRERMPRAPLLVPGYGAQGGAAADVVGAFGAGLSGALVSSSRGVLFAHRERPGAAWPDACRDAARKMVRSIVAAVDRASPGGPLAHPRP